MSILLIAVIMMLLSAILIYADKLYRLWCIKCLMKQRKRLTDEDIVAFYKETPLLDTDILVRWHEVANILGVEAGNLRPNDRLHKIVKLGFFTDDRIEDISDRAIELKQSLGLALDLQTIETLNDYINAFSAYKKSIND